MALYNKCKKKHICVSFMMKRPMFNLIDSGF